MFLDKLSASLLQICDAEHLSYERASERCACSSRHFANIVNRRAYPSLNVFEHICIGFGKTPNKLLGITQPEQKELAFRIPMPVTEIRAFPYAGGISTFPVCPQCACTLEREYQAYCDRCGQCLSWKNFKNTSVILRP